MRNKYKGISDDKLEKMITDNEWLNSEILICKNCSNKKDCELQKYNVPTLEQNYRYDLEKKISKNIRRDKELESHKNKMQKSHRRERTISNVSELFQNQVPFRKNTSDDSKLTIFFKKSPREKSARLNSSEFSTGMN